MAYQEIGKIAMTPRGNWVNGENYQQLDIVTHEGNIYIASKDIANGIQPGSTTSDWQLLLTTEQVQSNLNQQINQLQNIINTIASKQQTLDKTINIIKNIYGAPAKASSVNEMTDTNRVYVYIGETSNTFINGHWYYYNGSTWTDGGEYNSTAVWTDPTLTLEGAPADAKATGELKATVEAVCPTLEQTDSFIAQDGAIDAPLTGLTIYGKSYQDTSISPTPSSPKSITTAGSSGTLELVSAGKNMIPLTNPETRTSYGITFTRLSNGAVTFNGQNNNKSASLYVSNYFVLPAGTYILSGAHSNGDLSEGDIQLLLEGNTIARSYGSTNESFTIQNTALRLQFVLRLRKGSTFTRGTFRPMIRMANIDDSKFTPRDSVFASIPTQGGLPGVPVFSGGNYTDTDGQHWICDTIDLEAGVWTKRCGVVKFNGQSADGWERVNAANSKYRFRNTTLASEIMKAATNDTVIPLLCTHYAWTSANATWTNNSVNGIAVDNGGGIFVADVTLRDAGTLEQFLARFQTTAMTIVYPLATPEEIQLTEEQLTALRSIRSRKGLTYLYSTDQVQPEFSAEMYVDIPTYIQSMIGTQEDETVQLYDLNITPGMWNNIHPDFEPETEEYTVTLRKGNTATVNAVVIGTTVTVTFGTIGGARTYFTMSTSSSAVGDRKTYSCEVNPYDAGVGGGLVMTVTKGDLSRKYYLSITSVE